VFRIHTGFLINTFERRSSHVERLRRGASAQLHQCITAPARDSAINYFDEGKVDGSMRRIVRIMAIVTL